MKQGLSIVTLGVRDLEATRRFYEEKFGWKTEAANNDIVFFKLNGSLFGLSRTRLWLPGPVEGSLRSTTRSAM